MCKTKSGETFYVLPRENLRNCFKTEHFGILIFYHYFFVTDYKIILLIKWGSRIEGGMSVTKKKMNHYENFLFAMYMWMMSFLKKGCVSALQIIVLRLVGVLRIWHSEILAAAFLNLLLKSHEFATL